MTLEDFQNVYKDANQLADLPDPYHTTNQPAHAKQPPVGESIVFDGLIDGYPAQPNVRMQRPTINADVNAQLQTILRVITSIFYEPWSTFLRATEQKQRSSELKKVAAEYLIGKQTEDTVMELDS